MRKILNASPKSRDKTIIDASLEGRIIDLSTTKKPEALSTHRTGGMARLLGDPFVNCLGFHCESMNDSFTFTLMKNDEPKWLKERFRAIATRKRERSCDVLQDSPTCRLKSILEPLGGVRHLPIPYEHSFQRIFKFLAIGMMSVCGEYVGKVCRTARWIVDKGISFDKPQPTDLLRVWKKVDNIVVSSLRSYEELVAKQDGGNLMANLAFWLGVKRTDGRIAHLDKFLVASLRKIRLLKNKIETIERLMERELQTR